MGMHHHANQVMMTMMMKTKISLFFALVPTFTSAAQSNYRFAIVPKDTTNPFFLKVQEGCESAAARLTDETQTVECIFTGPANPDPDAQAAIIQDLINQRNISGIAVSVLDDSLASTLAAATAANISVVTVDSDLTNETGRLYYIGTNNTQMGQRLGETLLVVDDCTVDCSYSLLSDSPPNIQERQAGILGALQDTVWTNNNVDTHLSQDQTNVSLAIMREWIQTYPDLNAIVAAGGWPMFDEDAFRAFVSDFPDVTLVVADTLDAQVTLLNQGYVAALVGQKPINMGIFSIEALLAASQGREYTNAAVNGFVDTGIDVLIYDDKSGLNATSRGFVWTVTMSVGMAIGLAAML